MGSHVGSRVYLVEQRTGRTAHIETWSAHSTYTSVAKALREARKLSEVGGSYRICEYVFNRVSATIHNYRPRSGRSR